MFTVGTPSRLDFRHCALPICILLATAISVQASSTVIYSFSGRGGDGSTPNTSLVFDSAGNLYGATQSGGSGPCLNGCGAVFELSPTSEGGWQESVIYSFQSAGDLPVGGLTMDNAGNIYGLISGGNTNACGSVYRLSPGNGGWTESVLYAFCAGGTGGHGRTPVGKVVFDSQGNLWGATALGGLHDTGVIYTLTPTTSGMWTQTVQYQ